jgi:hypothetical protein
MRGEHANVPEPTYQGSWRRDTSAGVARQAGYGFALALAEGGAATSSVARGGTRRRRSGRELLGSEAATRGAQCLGASSR